MAVAPATAAGPVMAAATAGAVASAGAGGTAGGAAPTRGAGGEAEAAAVDNHPTNGRPCSRPCGSVRCPMFRTVRWLMTWFLCGVAAPVWAAAPTFKDRAHLFSPEAVDEAKTLIDGIRGQFHKDVAIETFPAV